MPKSVKEMLVERENHEDLKGLYSVMSDVDSAIGKLDNFKANTKLDESIFKNTLVNARASLSLSRANVMASIGMGVSGIRGLSEAKTFEEDFPFAHFSHGLMTCYVDPATNRFVLTKDSRNGLHNYDTIVLMTKNDLKNIIKVCTEMLEDEKAKKVPDDEEEVVNG